jgi:hypothetical protein
MPISENIEEVLRRHQNISLDGKCFSIVGDGWIPIIDSLFSQLSTLVKGEPVGLRQIKEKFGVLVVYMEPGQSFWRRAQVLIDKARVLSTKTCEVCGSPGEKRSCYSDGTPRDWIETLCDKCNLVPMEEETT